MATGERARSLLRGFFAYPSMPPQLAEPIAAAIGSVHNRADVSVRGWPEMDIAGRFIGTEVLSGIEAAEVLVADVTLLNFNVTYEIGFAIGRRKRIVLTRNRALSQDEALHRSFGLFDTLGYETYANSNELETVLVATRDGSPIPFDVSKVNDRAPVFLLSALHKTDSVIRLISRIKKARLSFRSFDPEETPRLSALDTIDHVAKSHGVIVPLLPAIVDDAQVHNLRAAFVAGLATGMERPLLLLQQGFDPVPLDYRDLVSSYTHPHQIDEFVAEFAPSVLARFQAGTRVAVQEPTGLLARLNLGASAAENELRDLPSYYLETDEYRRTLRGEARLATGRKGSGKTALFAQLRNRLRSDPAVVVLDLRPEGYQLLKFKRQLLEQLERGTFEHTITAFWEYLLLLEVCHKLLEKDRQLHLRNHQLYAPYQALSGQYAHDEYVSEGDFSERLSHLLGRIADDFRAKFGSDTGVALSQAQVTSLLYKHDVGALRHLIEDYLQHKKGLWILVDNLDKGWPASGVLPEDVLILRCLIDAARKLEQALSRRSIETHSIVFIRNDVYELLVDSTPDRGKESRVSLDWRDPDMLREVLRRRFVFNGLSRDASFAAIWAAIAAPYIDGEETSQYLIDRSLMRPRCLLDLVNQCRANAVNLGHSIIEVDDIRKGEERYSSELLKETDLELRDVHPGCSDVLYGFIGVPDRISYRDVSDAISTACGSKVEPDQVLDLLLWYGVLGLLRDTGEPSYIYSLNYDMKKLKALTGRVSGGSVFCVNPAFWSALEVQGH